VRLERPSRVVVRFVAAALKVAATLARPVGVVGIVLAYALVDLPRDSADRALVADVGRPEPAGGHAAEILSRLDEHDRLANWHRLDGRADAAGRAAVDDNVEITFSGSCFRRENKECCENPAHREAPFVAVDSLLHSLSARADHG